MPLFFIRLPVIHIGEVNLHTHTMTKNKRNIKETYKSLQGKERYKRLERITLAFFILLILTVFLLGSQSLYYQFAYKQAIKTGAENTVIAIKMTAACARLGNFTQEEILRETMEMFILNKDGGE